MKLSKGKDSDQPPTPRKLHRKAARDRAGHLSRAAGAEHRSSEGRIVREAGTGEKASASKGNRPGIARITGVLLAGIALAGYLVLLVARVAFVSSILALGLPVVNPPLLHAAGEVRDTRLLERRATAS